MSGLHGVYGRKKSIHKREFYIDGRTYPTSISDLVTVEKLATGEFTSVSAALYLFVCPSVCMFVDVFVCFQPVLVNQTLLFRFL